MNFDARKSLEEAFRLQKMIKAKRAEVRSLENQYKTVMDRLAAEKVGRVGDLERVEHIMHRRSIIPEAFRQHFPEAFVKLARFTMKDVLAEIEESQLKGAGAIEVKEMIAWEVISRPEV